MGIPNHARPVRVAFDVGPLHGTRSGVGEAVAGMSHALAEHSNIELDRYLLSLRSTPQPGVRKLPFPAALAHRWWQRRAPRVDRLLGRPDLVHGTNYVVPPTRCPRLVSVYDCWFLDHADQANPDVVRASRVLRRSVDDGAAVVTSSDATTERVRLLLDTDRVTTVHLGPPAIPELSAQPEGSSSRPAPSDTIVSIGTVERRKNLPRLVAAFGLVANEHASARLVIAGSSGDDSHAVDRAIAQLDESARRRVERHGRVSDAKKFDLLRDASVLAYVSLDEGFGFPLLEAQQLGVPIVASTAGSIPEVAGPAALFSAATDIDAIAANLHLALTSESVRAKLVAQGTSNVGRFSWDQTGRQLASLYQHLVEDQ